MLMDKALESVMKDEDTRPGHGFHVEEVRDIVDDHTIIKGP
jgi:hypothetical protein